MSTVVPDPNKPPVENIVSSKDEADRHGPLEESDEPMIIHVSAFAYLRTMWSLFWTAFRHPLTTTYIDVATGEVVDPYEEAM